MSYCHKITVQNACFSDQDPPYKSTNSLNFNSFVAAFVFIISIFSAEKTINQSNEHRIH